MSNKVGRGTYNLSATNGFKQSYQKHAFNQKSLLQNDSIEKTYPGPAKYETLNSKGPIKAIGAKFKVENGINFDVGPAFYKTDDNFHKKRGISFTKSKQRPDIINDFKRAPTYDRYSTFSVKKGKGGRFGKSRKANHKLMLDTLPGPGTYEESDHFNSIERVQTANNHTTRMKNKEINVHQTHGPGRYSISTGSVAMTKGGIMACKNNKSAF
jgi:hypothetical protein